MSNLPCFVSNKRIRAEIVKDPIHFVDAIVYTDDGGYVFEFKSGIVRCPFNYPFEAPSCPDMRFIKTILKPHTWCIVIMMRPDLLTRIPTWNIPCMCCHSLTCANQWNVHATIREMSKEVCFHHLYHDVDKCHTVFSSLPVDILEYMVLKTSN